MKGIEMKCRLCAVDSQNTTFDIFGTGGLQEKIRKYLQITVKLNANLDFTSQRDEGRHNWKNHTYGFNIDVGEASVFANILHPVAKIKQVHSPIPV